MDENDIKLRLDAITITDIHIAVEQLFDKAKAKNYSSYCDAIKGVSKFDNFSVGYIDRDIHQVTEHFTEFYNWSKGQRIENKQIHNFLQFIVYGLFWENTAVQRLLSSLIEIASVGSYNVPEYMQTDHRTYCFYNRLISNAQKNLLDIAIAINALYNNQLRNAAVHAQIHFSYKGITLMNHKKNSPISVPAISYDLWEELFVKTKVFIEILFNKRFSED